MDMMQEDIVDTIQAMRRQEDLNYMCRNCYEERNPMNHPSAKHRDTSCSSYEVVTIQTRNVLCDWANKIIDFCTLDRETVEIAFSYVDRFVSTDFGCDILQQSDKFQLLVVTSLYVAIKVHETVAISTSQFEKISRNTFTAKDVESMERILLEGLNWHLHPPTSLCFVRLFLDMIPTKSIDQDTRDTAFILAKLQTELSTRDCALVSARASTVAFASLMNAFEALGMMDSAAANFTVHSFVSQAASLSLVNKELFYDNDMLRPIQIRLYHAIAKQNEISMFVGSSPPSTVTPSSPAPTTPKRGVARKKSFEETPRSIISRQA